MLPANIRNRRSLLLPCLIARCTALVFYPCLRLLTVSNAACSSCISGLCHTATRPYRLLTVYRTARPSCASPGLCRTVLRPCRLLTVYGAACSSGVLLLRCTALRSYRLLTVSRAACSSYAAVLRRTALRPYCLLTICCTACSFILCPATLQSCRRLTGRLSIGWPAHTAPSRSKYLISLIFLFLFPGSSDWRTAVLAELCLRFKRMSTLCTISHISHNDSSVFLSATSVDYRLLSFMPAAFAAAASISR